MITLQKLTFTVRLLHHVYGDKSHAAPQPAATHFVKINTISVELLLTVCSKSCYTCVLNSILNLDFLSSYSIAIQEHFMQYLLWGIWHFPQRDTKVNCDLSLFYI